ncbi:MAG: DUF5615 family PIN-like protein [Candidatus Poribacteria bacterium]|nr:DUF5615 family PIN-like protein [Candidatus Poribacteria bacterium]
MNGFLIDENLPPSWRDQLIQRVSVDVWCVGDPGAPPMGSPDSTLLLWCERHDFILVTHDRRTMSIHLSDHHAAGHHVPGILTVPNKTPSGDILIELAVIAGASRDNEFRDRLLFLPLLH